MVWIYVPQLQLRAESEAREMKYTAPDLSHGPGMASFLARRHLSGLHIARLFVSEAFSGRQAARLIRHCMISAALVGCAANNTVPLAEIISLRKQADQLGSVVSVYPLVDSVRADHLNRIGLLESSGLLQDAVELAESSLARFPGDPLIWQVIAELNLQTGDLARSMEAAGHSRSLGPARGALCARSWQVLSRAHDLMGNDALATEAASQIADCALLREERY